ncbi:hypothetical protein EDC94DRAFT_509315 [Helicostylum pulchrum]|nr:hypothetical protein EDC94DRAFT_509315 [Helicostylum pulchrum]
MNQDLMISSGIQDELLRLDENSLHTRYKFGVLLIKEGQTREEEWFSNDHDSEPFNQFLNIIGNPVKLKGYTGWAAGLDTKSGDSGDYTYTNVWNENILAYHVSTLIPSRPGDKQQIQRKRHIGNDIVCIVFVEGNQPFNPTAIKSQFLHVFIVVHQEVSNKAKLWRVEIVSVKDVPDFGPSLPENSAVFYNEKELEQFLLAKLVNAEYAAFKSPKFASPMNRAREGIFTNLVEKGWKLLFNDSNISSSSTANNTTNISLLNNNNNNNTNNNISTSTTTTTTTTTSSSPTRKLLFHTKSASTSSSSQSTPPPTSGYDTMMHEQYPGLEEFNAIVNDYLQNLSSKKRDKALVDSTRYKLILQVLKDPRNTAISTAQFRFWVKKMFKLVTFEFEEFVCHDNKPVAIRENIYSILVIAHTEAHHGGRDKTSALVRKSYSWIPKELIARFVRHCPFCISRRNGCQSSTKNSLHNYSMAANVATSAAAVAVAASTFHNTPTSSPTIDDSQFDFYYSQLNNTTTTNTNTEDCCQDSPKPNLFTNNNSTPYQYLPFSGNNRSPPPPNSYILNNTNTTAPSAAAAAAVVAAAAIAAVNLNQFTTPSSPSSVSTTASSSDQQTPYSLVSNYLSNEKLIDDNETPYITTC